MIQGSESLSTAYKCLVLGTCPKSAWQLNYVWQPTCKRAAIVSKVWGIIAIYSQTRFLRQASPIQCGALNRWFTLR